MGLREAYRNLETASYSGQELATEFTPRATSFSADKLAYCHVYGITRRGFGASTYPPPQNSADSLGEDVVAVIRALRLNKSVLVGHSTAGAELTSVATLHPSSIAGVVYWEAAYPYAFDDGKGPSGMRKVMDCRCRSRSSARRRIRLLKAE